MTTKYNEVNEMENCTISKHAKERYAERIMGKENSTDVCQFIALHTEKIEADINKLIYYGTLIYSGRQFQKDGKGNIIDVYLKDCWVVLVDNKAKNVITLYKIDLGLDDEFNLAYISKMIEKLNSYKAILENTKQQIENESSTYREMMDDAEAQIKEYRTMIKNLEELCVGYKTIIDNNYVRLAQANNDVANIVNTLVGKREF